MTWAIAWNQPVFRIKFYPGDTLTPEVRSRNTAWNTLDEINRNAFYGLVKLPRRCELSEIRKEKKYYWTQASKGRAAVRSLASHQCGAGWKSWRRCHMWVEFAVGYFPCSERFFSEYSGFPLSLKTNNSKFQFDLVTHGHVLTSSHETPKCSVGKQITITKFIETTRAFGTNVNTRWRRFRFHSESIPYRKICDRRYVFVTVVAPLYEASKIECKAVKTAFNYTASNKTVFTTYR